MINVLTVVQLLIDKYEELLNIAEVQLMNEYSRGWASDRLESKHKLAALKELRAKLLNSRKDIIPKCNNTTIRELNAAYNKAKSAMWDAKAAFYTASDGFVYNIYRVIAKDILDPIPEDSVVGKIQNAAAAYDWWWHGRNTDYSYVLFTNNMNFNFDTVAGIKPIIEEEIGTYHTIAAVVYREAETIKRIHDTLGEMLNQDSLLSRKDYCLSKLLAI